MNFKDVTEIALRVTSSEVRVDAGLHFNLYAAKPIFYSAEDSVYDYYPKLNLQAQYLYPKKLGGALFDLSLLGKELHKGNLSVTLDDFHKKDQDGCKVYKKYRGDLLPVMNPAPKGIGTYEKVRGENRWTTTLWMGQDYVRDVMAALAIKQEVFIYMNTYTEKRIHWITHFSMTSKNPLEDML